ncbi:UNVERIFIED_CONTAM: hypothetical protein ABIC26_003782 [Paenibacillus sp. PvR008]
MSINPLTKKIMLSSATTALLFLLCLHFPLLLQVHL